MMVDAKLNEAKKNEVRNNEASRDKFRTEISNDESRKETSPVKIGEARRRKDNVMDSPVYGNLITII
jgi:hypothetical protein